MTEGRSEVLAFGRFNVDARRRSLCFDGRQIDLHPKAFDILLLFVTHAGEVLTKEQVMKTIWADSFVEDSNLTQTIYVLRRILKQHEEDSDYIKTIPKRGYQFVADVHPRESAAQEDPSGVDVAEQTALAPPRNPNAKAKRPRVALFAVFITALAGLGIYWAAITRRPQTGTVLRTLAVLPFRPLTSDQQNDAMELGMADALIIRLSAAHDLMVYPVSAVRRFAALEQDPVAAGRQLHADAVLDGRIQRAAGRLRVTAQLLRVADGRQLWADQYDGQYTDVFAMQDRISEQIAKSLALGLGMEDQQRAPRGRTRNVNAYEFYTKGRYFWNKRTPEGLEKSIEYFRQAIADDPRYALAYSGLADSYALLSDYGTMPPKDSLPQAKQAALRALDFDDTLAEAHTSLAFVAEVFEWDWARAEREYRRAIDLNPNYATGRHRYGMFLCWLGRFREALQELSRALNLDPTSLIINADTGLALLLARRYDEAADQLRSTIELDPNFYRAHVYLADCYTQQRKFKEAVAAAERASRNARNNRADIVLSYTYAAAGRNEEARKLLESNVAGEPRQPLYAAVTYSLLGDRNTALNILQEALRQHAMGALRLGVDPKLDSFRSDWRFQDFLKRMGLKTAYIE